jgi:SAM-dependent methyltransferase
VSVDDAVRSYWDVDSATYDRSSTHRPTSPAVQAAWATALARLLPSPPARILDCGAGTGFLSLIAAGMGHRVTALDLSPEMVEQLGARAKSEGLTVQAVVGSASEPPAGPFDVVMERHLLWTLPDPIGALRAWRKAAPLGRLVLVEGLWGGADPVQALRQRGRELLRRLRHQPSDHHAEYPADVRAAMPFGGGTHPSSLLEAIADAGWLNGRLERLWDVEWAATLELPLPERLLGVAPRFVVTAG